MNFFDVIIISGTFFGCFFLSQWLSKVSGLNVSLLFIAIFAVVVVVEIRVFRRIQASSLRKLQEILDQQERRP